MIVHHESRAQLDGKNFGDFKNWAVQIFNDKKKSVLCMPETFADANYDGPARVALAAVGSTPGPEHRKRHNIFSTREVP